MEQIVSSLKNNSLASKKKHLYSRLLDYFSLFVSTYLVFTLVNTIGTNLPSVKEKISRLNDINKEALVFIDETALQKLDKDTYELISSETLGREYILNVTKTSAYYHELMWPTKQDDGTYIDVEINKEDTFIGDLTDYSKDNLSHYYKLFKKSGHEGLESYQYEGIDYKDDIDTFLYKKIMNINTDFYIDAVSPRGEEISNFVIYNKDITSRMITRLARGETSDNVATEVFNDTYNGYAKAIKYGIDEVENLSVEYLNINSNFNKAYQDLGGSVLLMMLISYVIAYVLLTVGTFLFGKEWITLGQKMMKLGMTDTRENEPKWWNLCLYHLINFITFASSWVIAFYFVGIFGVLSFMITPHIALSSIFIALFTFNFLSIIVSFVSKKGFDISTFVSRILIKDKNEFDIAPGMEEIADGSETK